MAKPESERVLAKLAVGPGVSLRTGLSEFADRPLVARRYLGAWLVLVAALPWGLYRYYSNGVVPLDVGQSTSGAYMGVNFHVYHTTAERVLSGGPIYGVAPDPATSNFVYLYPPVTVPSFVPFTLVDWTTGYILFTALSVLAGLVATVLIVRYVELLGTPLGWLDVGLVFGLWTLSIHASATVFFGNINLFLGLAFAVGFWALATDRDAAAGFAFASAALFKLFPALVGLWLLRDRRWVATGSAILTGIGGVAAGAALYGIDPSWHFFTAVLPNRTDSSLFVGGYPVGGEFYVTVQRPLSHLLWSLWPDAPYALLPASAVAVCGLVLAFFYRYARTDRERLMAMFATVVVMLVVIPSFRLYAPLLFVPLVALLYTWQSGPGRRLFVLGGVLFSVVARPEHVLTAAAYLGPLAGPVETVGSVVTIQLLAYALLLAACGWHLTRRESEPM
jgi:hypothetical protein